MTKRVTSFSRNKEDSFNRYGEDDFRAAAHIRIYIDFAPGD